MDNFLWMLDNKYTPQNFLSDEVSVKLACEFALDCWQILPTVWSRLENLVKSSGSYSTYLEPVHDRLTSMQVLAKVQHRILGRFLSELESQYIPFVLLKGTASRALVYKQETDRCGVDIDIGIPKEAIYDAEKIALELGFYKAEWNRKTKRFSIMTDQTLRSQVESKHYQLGFLVREQVITGLSSETVTAIKRDIEHQDPWHLTESEELACYVSLDLHHGLALNCSVDGPIASAIEVEQGGLRMRVPSVSWLIFHLVYKIYMEGVATYKKGGYQYADLLRLVDILDSQGTQDLVRLFEKYTLEIPAFYVLRRLPMHFSRELKPELRDLLNKHGITPSSEVDAYQLNDLGDMWGKLWGKR